MVKINYKSLTALLYWLNNPSWTKAFLRIIFHFDLELETGLQFLTFKIPKSSSTQSIHLSLGLSLALMLIGLEWKTLDVGESKFILSTQVPGKFHSVDFYVVDDIWLSIQLIHFTVKSVPPSTIDVHSTHNFPQTFLSMITILFSWDFFMAQVSEP